MRLKMRIHRPNSLDSPITGEKFELMHLDSELTSTIALFKGIITKGRINFRILLQNPWSNSKILAPLTKKTLYVYVIIFMGITIHTF